MMEREERSEESYMHLSNPYWQALFPHPRIQPISSSVPGNNQQHRHEPTMNSQRQTVPSKAETELDENV